MATTNTLTWNKNPEPDVAKYNIYRNIGSAPIKAFNNLIASVANTSASPTYADVVSADGDYFYAVTAVDTSNNESALSVVKDKVVDSVPPSPPVGLVVV